MDRSGRAGVPGRGDRGVLAGDAPADAAPPTRCRGRRGRAARRRRHARRPRGRAAGRCWPTTRRAAGRRTPWSAGRPGSGSGWSTRRRTRRAQRAAGRQRVGTRRPQARPRSARAAAPAAGPLGRHLAGAVAAHARRGRLDGGAVVPLDFDIRDTRRKQFSQARDVLPGQAPTGPATRRGAPGRASHAGRRCTPRRGRRTCRRHAGTSSTRRRSPGSRAAPSPPSARVGRPLTPRSR